MQVRKSEAMKLRLKGLSYNEITTKLGVPKSTLSGWFSGMELSEHASKRLQNRVRQGTLNGLIKRNKAQTHEARKRARKIHQEAANSIEKLSKHELLLVGAALYWGEGYKKPVVKDGKERTHHMIGFTNSDPSMVLIFIRFLKEILEVPGEKISINIRLFPHQNQKEALRFWSEITGVPIHQFQKPVYVISKSSQGKRPYNQLPNGTIQVRVNDTKKFHTIMGFIEGIKLG